jgi:hypothetical protein
VLEQLEIKQFVYWEKRPCTHEIQQNINLEDEDNNDTLTMAEMMELQYEDSDEKL